MTHEPEDLEIRGQLDRAFPAPSPDEIGGAWERVSHTSRSWPGSTSGMARMTAAAALVVAAFTAGYVVGRSSAGLAERAVTERSPTTSHDPLVTIRPPELLPAAAVGGAS
jgi:hypothetical protein